MKFWKALPGPAPVKLVELILIACLVVWVAKNPAGAGHDVKTFFTVWVPAAADWLSRFFSSFGNG
jgi:hypothetical protein